MRLFRRQDVLPQPEHLVTTWEPSSNRRPRGTPSLTSDYAAVRLAVLRHVPALEEAVREEEDLTGMHEDPELFFELVEYVVWPHLERAAASGPSEVRPYGALIAEMLDQGDEQVRDLAYSELERIDRRRSVREAFVSAGYARMLDELR